ncbi:MAG: class I SAM-dependent methyltransferase [Myxococcota bacterium]
MNNSHTAADWAGTRGDKWRAHQSGIEALLAPVDEPLIHALQLDAPYRVADVGCGTGGTALEILRRAPKGTVVHGYDISPPMIEAASARVPPKEPAIAFEVADMATATVGAQPYHRLTSRFGVMFFPDPQAAFANLRRWLAPGGRFAFAVWGHPSDNPWITTVREVVAKIVDIPPPDPEAPGPFRYAEADKLVTLLTRVGFSELDVRNWRGALPMGGGLPPAEAARFALASFSTFAEQLEKAGNDSFNEAHQTLTTRLSRHQRDGAVWMDASVHLFTGARSH